MSLETELTAILTAAAIAPITDKAFLRITGSDATRWLNGMVTNNIKDLGPGEGNYNFLLNNQGRIQADCTIYREPNDGPATFLLETGNGQLETVNQILDKFIIMDDVELSPAMTDKLGLLVLGTGALGTLDVGLTWPTPPISISYGSVADPAAAGKEVILSLAPDRYEIWGDESLHAWMNSLGERQVSPAALEAYRILSGTPRYGIDIRNTDTARDLPQETAQTHALNFNKGCYLGQEIVERIHSRGQVHRTFARLELKPTSESQELIALPTLPCALTLDGKTVGDLTSAALIPLASGPTLRALGYIRREAANATLTYPGGTANVLPPK